MVLRRLQLQRTRSQHPPGALLPLRLFLMTGARSGLLQAPQSPPSPLVPMTGALSDPPQIHLLCLPLRTMSGALLSRPLRQVPQQVPPLLEATGLRILQHPVPLLMPLMVPLSRMSGVRLSPDNRIVLQMTRRGKGPLTSGAWPSHRLRLPLPLRLLHPQPLSLGTLTSPLGAAVHQATHSILQMLPPTPLRMLP